MAFATKCRTNVVEILLSCTLQGVQYGLGTIEEVV